MPPLSTTPARAASHAEVELSFRRSRIRRRVLLTLSAFSEASPRALAMACGIDAQRLRWVVHGHWPQYRVELSLARLGLAEEIWTPNGRMYAITARGRKKARQLAARWSRRPSGRAAEGVL